MLTPSGFSRLLPSGRLLTTLRRPHICQADLPMYEVDWISIDMPFPPVIPYFIDCLNSIVIILSLARDTS